MVFVSPSHFETDPVVFNLFCTTFLLIMRYLILLLFFFCSFKLRVSRNTSQRLRAKQNLRRNPSLKPNLNPNPKISPILIPNPKFLAREWLATPLEENFTLWIALTWSLAWPEETLPGSSITTPGIGKNPRTYGIRELRYQRVKRSTLPKNSCFYPWSTVEWLVRRDEVGDDISCFKTSMLTLEPRL